MLIDQEHEHWIVVPQSILCADGFRMPTMYYIINAFGEAVCFRTTKREKAQQWADEEYGKGKYVVRCRNINKECPKPAEHKDSQGSVLVYNVDDLSTTH